MSSDWYRIALAQFQERPIRTKAGYPSLAQEKEKSMLKAEVTCVSCGLVKYRCDFVSPRGKLLSKCTICRQPVHTVKEPRILVELEDVFLNILKHLPITCAVRCSAVTRKTSCWVSGQLFWEAMTRKLGWFDPRFASSQPNWKTTFQKFWKAGFYYDFRNEHDIAEPRINMSRESFELELIIDGVPTMQLPWYYSTTEFWLKPLDGDPKNWDLNSEKIADALNSGDLEYLCNEELHKHIGQLLPKGPYYTTFRTVHPHWFDGNDIGNYFSNQHAKFSNRRIPHNPISEGFYQSFWKMPWWKSRVRVMQDVDDVRVEVPVGIYEIIIPLQNRKKLNPERVEFYKQQIQAGDIPTVLTVSMIDDRKTIFSVNSAELPPIMTKYDHLTTVVNWVIDGHHKLEAAAQLNAPIRFLQFVSRDPYRVFPDGEALLDSSLLEKLVSNTGKSRSYSELPVGYRIKKLQADPPPFLINGIWRRSWEDHSEIDFCERDIARLLLDILDGEYSGSFGTYYNQDRDEKEPKKRSLDFFLKHFQIIDGKCWVWPKNEIGMIFCEACAIAVPPEAVVEGLFEASPALPTKLYVPIVTNTKEEYYK